MKYIYAGFAIAALAFNANAFAEETGMANETVQHYQVEAPKNHEDALNILQKYTADVGKILSKDKVDGNDLESIHEHSYHLEKAVDKLRKDAVTKAQTDAVDNVDEAVQAMHNNSENHKEAETREWYGKLQPAVDAAEAAFNHKA